MLQITLDDAIEERLNSKPSTYFIIYQSDGRGGINLQHGFFEVQASGNSLNIEGLNKYPNQ